jgi:hypothetical protein
VAVRTFAIPFYSVPVPAPLRQNVTFPPVQVQVPVPVPVPQHRLELTFCVVSVEQNDGH